MTSSQERLHCPAIHTIYQMGAGDSSVGNCLLQTVKIVVIARAGIMYRYGKFYGTIAFAKFIHTTSHGRN